MSKQIKQSKNAIALLITVLFVIVITVAIGFGLRQVNEASSLVKNESFMYQSNILVEDIISVLQNSPDVARVADTNSSDELFNLLSQASFIPFESSGFEIVLKLHSARAKFNPNNLNEQTSNALREYMSINMVNNQYVDILLDTINGVKIDNSYNSRIFDENPYLFRDYIVSRKHLEQVNDFFTKEYNDNSLKNVAFENLFYFGSDKNSSVDLNYATQEVWELMLGCQKERAEFLALNAGVYSDVESLDLSNGELENLQRFKTSFSEPILFVEIEIQQSDNRAHISFEYDIENKKGSNFVYEI